MTDARKAVRKPVRRSITEARERPEDVMPGDFIDYRLSLEIQPQPGQKAWVTWGTSSQVRDQESTEEAVQRISKFVEDGLDERLAAQSE